MEDCIFCKIVKGEIGSEKVYGDNDILAFRDINPAAPVHIVIIPKKHIAKINDLTTDDANIISHIFMCIKEIAAKEGISEDGYRVVSNCGDNAGQSVHHIHFHLLGGRNLNWPPG